jgi:plastocyanin
MKTIITLFILFVSLTFVTSADALIREVQVGPGFTNSFSPSNVAANVGDTIRWTWVSGTHDVTSTSVPGGAATFASPIQSTGTFMYKVTVVGNYNYVCTLHPGMNGSLTVTTGVEQISSIVDVFRLKQNFPNPFNPSTKINFSIPSRELVTLAVYDLVGNQVETLVSEELNAGEYEFNFNAKNLTSGVYFYTLRAGNLKDTKRMLLVK